MTETLLPQLSPRLETLALIRMVARIISHQGNNSQNISRA